RIKLSVVCNQKIKLLSSCESWGKRVILTDGRIPYFGIQYVKEQSPNALGQSGRKGKTRKSCLRPLNQDFFK
ncbi:MAG: hypothetical protein ACKOJE_01265, partial [Bacteroidota bacterium]